jgi:ABC-type branched-subunit amino acid transport system substrate-binding protein
MKTRVLPNRAIRTLFAACGIVYPSLMAIGSAQADDIVLGMSAAFKGPSRGLGIELYRGSMAYFEHINRAGGVHGRKIVIKAYDDGYQPVPAIRNTIRLIEKDNVFLLHGYVGTPTVTRVLPLLKLYEDRSAYLFFSFTGAQPQRIPPYEEFCFNLRASYHQETGETVKNFLNVGRTRIAMFYQIDAFGRGGWDGVRKELDRHKLKIVAEATYKRGSKFSQSFKDQVEILKNAEPDAVICVGAYEACAGFVRDARDAGLDIPISNVSFVGSESLLQLLVETGKSKGKDYTRNLINSQVVPSYSLQELAAVREYREYMEKYRPMPPADLMEKGYEPVSFSYVSFEGFLNAKVLVEILKRLGPDPKKKRIKTVVESIDKLDLGIEVPVSFGPRRHQGLDSVYFTAAENGQFVPLKDWTRWSK